MVRGKRGSEIRLSGSLNEALKLIDKLASDEDFRKRFVKAPQTILKEAGIHLPPDEMPKRMTLPSEKQLRALARQLRREASGPPLRFRRFILFGAFRRFAARFSPAPRPTPPPSAKRKGTPVRKLK